MKKPKITHTKQQVAANILNSFECMMMGHKGDMYTAEEIFAVMKREAEYYELCDNPFTHMYCTTKEAIKSQNEYDKQLAVDQYGHCDWLE